MIIQIGTEVDESRISWKHKEYDEWKRADIDSLIEAYENKQKEPKSGDSISRQALIDEITEEGNGAVLSYTQGMDEDELVERIEKQMIEYFIKVIEHASPTELKRPQGEWVTKTVKKFCAPDCWWPGVFAIEDSWDEEEGSWLEEEDGFCSECGKQDELYNIHNYCPRCGADMRGE